MKQLSARDLAQFIDHTLLRPDASSADIDQLCAEARQHHFYAVCVSGSRVSRAFARLEESDVKVVAVVGFPLGAGEGDAKRYETEVAVDHGAAEIDTVLNVGLLKDGEDRILFRELRDIVEAADERPVKLILETCLLSNEEIVQACHLALEAGVHWIKTSTGFARAGATVEHVRLIRETVGPKVGVKASGGIRDLEFALQLIEAGATRLGTSSSVALVTHMAVSQED